MGNKNSSSKMSKAERKLQEEAIRLGMPVPSAKKTTETPVKPAASVTTTESRAERRARIMAEQKALIAAGESSEEEETPATEAPKGDFDFAETEEALPTKDDAFLMFLNNNDVLAEEADETSGAGCDDFFGGNDIVSEDVREYERDSADAAEIIEYRAEVAEELAKESSPAVPEETRAERRARLMAEQRALLDTDSDSEDEEVVPLLTGKATVTPPYTPKPTEEPKEEEAAEKSEETREERRARILAEQRALMNSDSESEDEEEEEDEESEAESDDEDADDASVAGQTTAVVLSLPALERTATLESIPEETTPDMAVIDLDEALKSVAESDDESDDESEEVIVSKSQAKFIPNERQLSVVSGPSSSLKSASLMVDDDCEDIKYATLSRSLHQKRRKAAPKVRAVTTFKSQTSQRRRSVRCPKFGRRRCPGMSKTAPGPGSYNVNYSSFGQKKSFSVRKCTFGSTSIGAAGSRSMHITRSGHVIYKSSARPARKCAGVRTVARPAWSLKQKRRKQTPLKRNLHQATKKVSPRSRKTKSKAKITKKVTVEVTEAVNQASAQESATREAARRVEELRAQLAQMKEQSATPVVEEPIAEPQIEAVEEVEEESKAPQRKYVADDDSSCGFEGGDDISDMDSIAALLRANGISGY